MNSFAHIPWLGLVFILIGVSAVTSILVSLFLAIGRRPKRVHSPSSIPNIDSWDFLQALSAVVNAPLQIGGHATVLNNGNEFFPAILEAINNAKFSINFMVYIWEAGEASTMMLDALIAAQKRGVEVRILFDGWGASNAPKDKVKELLSVGGKTCWFRPIRFGKILQFYKRNHRRAIIIDGQIGFLGGAAIMDKWLGNAEEPKSWRDVMARVTGPMAQSLQSAFTQLWADTQGEILIGQKYYPYPEPFDTNNLENQSRHISVISSPSSEFHPMSSVYWLTFRAARKSIYITQSYFVPDKALREALKERARAGIDVRVLVPNGYIDGALIRWASHRYFEEFLEAGVRIYEYQPTMIHSKTIVVDGSWSIIGSANLDVRSTELNKENVLCISDKEFATELEQTFLQDIQLATQFNLKFWKRRRWIRKVREYIASLFEEQY
jgi:cardiolipin synthase A/B